MALKIKPRSFMPAISSIARTNANTPASAAVRAARNSARRTAQGTPPPALTRARTAVIVVPPAPSSIPALALAKSAGNVNEIVNKTPSGPSLYERVCTTRNLVIGGAVIGSAAVAAAFGVLASQVGTLAASQIVAANTVAFLQPGLTIFGFALKTGMFMTLNTVVPVTSGLITISLPVISSVVVTAIGGYVIFCVMNKMIEQLVDSKNSLMTTMKDTVTELPGKLLKQVPGYSLFTSMFSSKEAPLPKDQEIEARKQEIAASQKRQKDEIIKANEPILKVFKELHDAAITPEERAKYANTVELLKGERQPSFADTSASKGLADFFDEQGQEKSGIYTRQACLQEQAARQAIEEVD